MRYCILFLLLLSTLQANGMNLTEAPGNRAFLTNVINEEGGAEVAGLIGFGKRADHFGDWLVALGNYKALALRFNVNTDYRDSTYLSDFDLDLTFADHFWKSYSYGLVLGLARDEDIKHSLLSDSLYKDSLYTVYGDLGLTRRFPISSWKGTHTIGVNSRFACEDFEPSTFYVKHMVADWFWEQSQDRIHVHGSLGWSLQDESLLYGVRVLYHPPRSEVGIGVYQDTLMLKAGWKPPFAPNGLLGIEAHVGRDRFRGGMYLSMQFTPSREEMICTGHYSSYYRKVIILENSFKRHDTYCRLTPFRALNKRSSIYHKNRKFVSTDSLFRDDIVAWNISILADLEIASHIKPFDFYLKNGGVGLNQPTFRLLKSMVRCNNSGALRVYAYLDSITLPQKIVRVGNVSYKRVPCFDDTQYVIVGSRERSCGKWYHMDMPRFDCHPVSIFEFRKEIARYYMNNHNYEKAREILNEVPAESKFYKGIDELKVLCDYFISTKSCLEIADKDLLKAYLEGRAWYDEMSEELLALLHTFDTKSERERIKALIHEMKPYYRIIKKYRRAVKKEKKRILELAGK